MTRLPILTALTAAATVAMSLAASAVPLATITSVTGVWGPLTGGQNKASFDGGAEVRWGGIGDTRTEKSGYRFDAPAGLPIGGIGTNSQFNLGKFTHFNNPIPAGSSITQAVLTLNYSLTFGDPDDSNIDYNGNYSSEFTFVHDETPNATPCGNGGNVPVNNPPCADKVTALLNPGNSDEFVVGGLIYFLAIDGFTVGGDPFTSFLTREGAINEAQLNGIFTTTPAAIPLPAPFLLLLGGMAGLGLISRKRKAA